MSRSRPVRPEELDDGSHIPDLIFDIVNAMIREKWDGESVVIEQRAILERIEQKIEMSRKAIIDKGWLNFERAYMKAGWIVEYDKPGYCETYPATFTFRVAS